MRFNANPCSARPDLAPKSKAAGFQLCDALGDQLRVEARLPVTGHGQIELARVGHDRLAAVTVAAVPSAVLTGEMMIHLCVQRPFRQRLLQRVKKATLVERRPGIGAAQQLVQNRVRYRRLFAAGHRGSPSVPSCPAAHEIPDSSFALTPLSPD